MVDRSPSPAFRPEGCAMPAASRTRIIVASLFAIAGLRGLYSMVLAVDAAKSDLLKTFVSEFVDITPGQGQFPNSFQQGSEKSAVEKPSHEVTVLRPFAIAKYEVPQNLYEHVVGNNPSK